MSSRDTPSLRSDEAHRAAARRLALGRPPRRRFYMFAIGADPAATSSWTRGAAYALPRAGFRREWGHEWVNADSVRPLLRVPVRPEDFPLRDAVIGLSTPEEFRRVSHHLRAAKRKRASTPSRSSP